MEKILDLIAEDWYRLAALAPRLLIALVVLLVAYFVGKYLARLVAAVLRKAALHEIHEAFFRTLTISIALFLGLVMALNILGLERVAVSILAGGGITAVVLGFAFREIGENFLAGIFLAFSRPFRRGDLIRTEDIEGEVRDVELRYTHLRTEDGRDVYVPSSQLFSRPLTNYTRDGLRRFSFTVGIDYSNDARAACELLARTARGIDGVLGEPAVDAFIFSLAPHYVEIQVHFWLDVLAGPADVSRIHTEVMDACRIALLEGGYKLSSETATNIALASNVGGVSSV